MLSKLKDIQIRNGWRDHDMAERLGIARSTWTDLKNGQLVLSERVQMAAVRAFPELLVDLLTSVSNAEQDATRVVA
jgi:transcriptional regulator with XRE-family HTH domain